MRARARLHMSQGLLLLLCLRRWGKLIAYGGRCVSCTHGHGGEANELTGGA